MQVYLSASEENKKDEYKLQNVSGSNQKLSFDTSGERDGHLIYMPICTPIRPKKKGFMYRREER